MPDDYPTSQLMADIMATISDNAPVVVTVALLLAVVNFIIGWFMYSLSYLTKKPFEGR